MIITFLLLQFLFLIKFIFIQMIMWKKDNACYWVLSNQSYYWQSFIHLTSYNVVCTFKYWNIRTCAYWKHSLLQNVLKLFLHQGFIRLILCWIFQTTHSETGHSWTHILMFMWFLSPDLKQSDFLLWGSSCNWKILKRYSSNKCFISPQKLSKLWYWTSSFNFHTSQRKDISNVMELYKVTLNGSTMLKVILCIHDDRRFWWLFEKKKKHVLIRFHLIPKVVCSINIWLTSSVSSGFMKYSGTCLRWHFLTLNMKIIWFQNVPILLTSILSFWHVSNL
jgi:hypothetical protein